MVVEPQTTNFGLWPKRKLNRVTALLDGLGVRYQVYAEEDIDRERLESWCAWDPNSEEPHTAFHLNIWSDDLSKLGNKIVEMFPERKFGG